MPQAMAAHLGHREMDKLMCSNTGTNTQGSYKAYVIFSRSPSLREALGIDDSSHSIGQPDKQFPSSDVPHLPQRMQIEDVG